MPLPVNRISRSNPPDFPYLPLPEKELQEKLNRFIGKKIIIHYINSVNKSPGKTEPLTLLSAFVEKKTAYRNAIALSFIRDKDSKPSSTIFHDMDLISTIYIPCVVITKVEPAKSFI